MAWKPPPVIATAGISAGSGRQDDYMELLHIALPGCLRARDVRYGVTGDTGGHIRYLLELADALAASGRVVRVEIATRAFRGPGPTEAYRKPAERRSARVSVLRVPTESPDYLPKEELGSQIAGFADGLIAELRGRPVLPRVIHAHFGCAGEVAIRVREALGIPFIFTPHSLGAVKASVLPGAPGAALAARIAQEDRVIGAADAVILSSTDERDAQLSLYPSAGRARGAGRVRILPPGCDTARFGNASDPARRAEIAAEVDRFLDQPQKPLVLGLARPVEKKNLIGLVDAFAAHPSLRERANLAIYAGSRERIAAGEDESAETWRRLLERIDDLDLWGHVALPKRHAPGDVPAILDLAAERRGVFVNLAFNEPFGLTLLEAAASGVPVVATDSGGPVDILAACRNGLLAPARDPAAAGAAIARLLEDRRLWLDCALAGLDHVGRFSWAAHAEAYCDLVEELAPARPSRVVPLFSVKRERRPVALVVTDIDGTLTGDARGLAAFAEWRREHPEVAFAVATGRHLESARETLADWGAPQPDLFVTEVGAEIHRPARPGFVPDPDWRARIAGGWRRDAIAAVLRRFPAVVPQPAENQGPFKLSYFARDDHRLVGRIRTALAAAGCAATVIHSHGCYLDILPARASKGAAARHAARLLGVAPERIIAAGDSGNDRELLQAAAYPVAVASPLNELDDLPAEVERRLFRSRFGPGHGLLDGAAAALRSLRDRGVA